MKKAGPVETGFVEVLWIESLLFYDSGWMQVVFEKVIWEVSVVSALTLAWERATKAIARKAMTSKSWINKRRLRLKMVYLTVIKTGFNWLIKNEPVAAFQAHHVPLQAGIYEGCYSMTPISEYAVLNSVLHTQGTGNKRRISPIPGKSINHEKPGRNPDL